ncbi:hypothetical protein ACGF7W_34535 [Streptomyces sp. NPDC048219]|uniref:hypothetical protein n=1 Tax=Streptomyces sp. NPDC048219 TaxID=3365517 RepID=UPI00371481D3
MLQQLLRTVQALADGLLKPKPSRPVPVRILLTEDTAYDAESVMDWDGTYYGRLHFEGIILEGSPEQLIRFARELSITSQVVEAADRIDTGRPGAIGTGGAET